MTKKYIKEKGKITKILTEDNIHTENQKIKLDVVYCGICGTDYQKYIGMDNVQEWGHEIIATLSNSPHNYVTIRTTYACGKCSCCISGHKEHCSNWQRANINGFSNRIEVDPKCIIPLDDNLVDESYTLIEPLYVANSLIKHVEFEKNGIYTIIGNGTIGLLTAFLLKRKNVADVRIVGHRNMNKKKEFIKLINCKYYSDEELENALKGSRNVIVTSPYNTISRVINLAENYANITFNGISKQTKVELNMDTWHFKNLKIWPSFPHPQSDFKEEIEILRKEKDVLKKIITGIYSLDEIETAFEDLKNKTKDNIKILIKCKE